MRKAEFCRFMIPALLLTAGCGSVQERYAESDLSFIWEVETNFLDNNRSRSAWVIRNNGSSELPPSGWEIYFNFLRDIDPGSLPGEIAIEHINGDFFRMEPTGSFRTTPAADDNQVIRVFVGDLVSCYARIVRVGTTSLTVAIETWAKRHLSTDQVRVTEGTFVYVAIDEQGRPRPLPGPEA